ncbi:uncharacterized protein [Physcomitrium patens]
MEDPKWLASPFAFPPFTTSLLACSWWMDFKPSPSGHRRGLVTMAGASYRVRGSSREGRATRAERRLARFEANQPLVSDGRVIVGASGVQANASASSQRKVVHRNRKCGLIPSTNMRLNFKSSSEPADLQHDGMENKIDKSEDFTSELESLVDLPQLSPSSFSQGVRREEDEAFSRCADFTKGIEIIVELSHLPPSNLSLQAGDYD